MNLEIELEIAFFVDSGLIWFTVNCFNTSSLVVFLPTQRPLKEYSLHVVNNYQQKDSSSFSDGGLSCVHDAYKS